MKLPVEDGDEIQEYKEHSGTIKIAGGTPPKGAGLCAFRHLERSVLPIDFMSIGANAGQQATKAMGVFRYVVQHSPFFETLEVAFQPFLFKTKTTDPVTGEMKFKSVTIWRTLIMERRKI
jgi:hypothetical protein